MRQPLAYGIDFGTTNSSIAVAYADDVEVLPVEESAPRTQLGSIVYLHRDGSRAAGAEAVRAYLTSGSAKTKCSDCSLVDHVARLSACRQYQRGGRCNDARLMSGLKEFLSDPGLEDTHSWAVDFSLPALVAVMLTRLKREADLTVGADVRRVVLGHPVNFPGTEGARYRELQSIAMERLEQAAGMAGFEEMQFFPEPAAALIDEDLQQGTVLALDFGGGTFDAALVRFRPEGGTVVALQGASVGGELFNAELFDVKVRDWLGIDRDGVPNYIRAHLRTMSGARLLMSDSNFWTSTRDVPAVTEIFAGGHVFHFYRAIEDAKIRLSSQPETVIELRRPGIEMRIPVSRVELEERLVPHMDLVMDVIERTLEQAGETPGTVDLVIRTGGTSATPLFVRRVTEMFGEAKVQERHAFDSVAHGLASQARLTWGAA